MDQTILNKQWAQHLKEAVETKEWVLKAQKSFSEARAQIKPRVKMATKEEP